MSPIPTINKNNSYIVNLQSMKIFAGKGRQKIEGEWERGERLKGRERRDEREICRERERNDYQREGVEKRRERKRDKKEKQEI